MVLDLETIRLGRGNHRPGSDDPCVMEAAALLAGETWTDHPACVSPVIAAFLRRWNDALGDEDRQSLKPFARKVLVTNTGAADDDRRAWMVTDWMVRVHLPAWLRLAKLDAQAEAVERLPELVNAESWQSARAVILDAQDKADAAWAAAWDAAWAAAMAAARAAAWNAAWAAARAAAWDAARAAARDAARDAAWAAAWDAARAAARAALKPTIVSLQQSARGLLERMIAVGKV